MFVATSVAFACLLNLTLVRGYRGYCNVNRTLFVRKGDAAVFEMMNQPDIHDIDFMKTDDVKHTRIRIHWHKFENFTERNVYFDDQNRNRTKVSLIVLSKFLFNLEIKISALELNDNGTYRAYLLDVGTIFCWILFVFDLQQIPSGHINEDQGVRILGQPAASLMKRPVVNATMVWLLDGKILNETEYFVIQDGAIWTAKIPRALNGKNMTYQAVQDSGSTSEINLTINVSYGPDFPLKFHPSKAFYIQKAGDKMPEIQCAADCNPPCSISWGEHSSSGILRLALLSSSSSGEYTCTARNQGNGSVRVVERSVYVVVLDDAADRTAFAVLGSLQALSTILFGLFAVFFCRHVKGLSCPRCFHQTELCTQVFSTEASTTDEPSQNAQQNYAYTAAYEDLNTATGTTTTVSESYSTIKQEEATLKVAYENTSFSQSS